MKTVIWANCNGRGLGHFLKKTDFPGDTQVFENYMVPSGELAIEDVQAAAKNCDIFIAQPTEPHKQIHEHTVRLLDEFVPKSARRIYFQPLKSLAYNLLLPIGGYPEKEAPSNYFGLEDIEPFLRAHSLQEVMEAYDAGRIEFRCRWRLHDTLAEQRKRESVCHIKVADFMERNHQSRLMLTLTHPTSRVFAEMARQVWKLVHGRDVQPEWVSDNDAKLPCSEPLSQYVVNALSMNCPANPLAHERYRVFLRGAHAVVHHTEPVIHGHYTLWE